jgi:hypothetical protein
MTTYSSNTLFPYLTRLLSIDLFNKKLWRSVRNNNEKRPIIVFHRHMVRGMKFYIKRLIYAVATSALQFPGVWYADAVAGSDNINGVYTVFAGKQYANSTCSFLCSGPNWGTNGE